MLIVCSGPRTYEEQRSNFRVNAAAAAPASRGEGQDGVLNLATPFKFGERPFEHNATVFENSKKVQSFLRLI